MNKVIGTSGLPVNGQPDEIKWNDLINNTAKQTADLEANLINLLTPEQLIQLTWFIQQQTIVQRSTNQLSEEMDRGAIDVEAELERFIGQCSRTNSRATHFNYRSSIKRFQEYLARNGKDILHAKTMDAEGYVAYLSGDGLSPNSIRTDIVGIKGFYTYLSKHYDCMKNIFSGVKLPRMVNSKLTIIPNDKEVRAIIEYIREPNPKLACIVELISRKGFRCGAFEHMTVYRSGRFSTITKGKQFTGHFDEYEMRLIRENFGNTTGDNMVFTELTSNRIRSLFLHYTGCMRDLGLIREAYSLHDLRHYFATTEYRKNKDIFKLSNKLNHSGIAVTGNYLTTLKYDFD
jgi:site-specific recombinase XerD